MRKILFYIVVVSCVFLLAGCSNNTEDATNNPQVSLYSLDDGNEKTVTVIFDSDGGTTIAPVTLEKGSKIQKPDCAKDGYSLVEWRIGDEAWLFEQSRVYEDITLKAVWSINHYTVQFVDYDGTVLDSQTLNYNESISFKGKDPTEYISEKKSYRFVGWDKNIACVPANDLVFTAVYNFVGNIYDVTYLDSADNVLYIESVLDGNPATYSLKPNKSPAFQYIYSFKEWDHDLSSITENIIVRPIYDKASVGLTIENGVITQYTESSSRGNVEILIPTHWDGVDVTEIGEMAFYGLKYITDITIPEGITKTGFYAFAYSTSLKTVVFPSTIQSIGVGSFAYSTNLTTVKLGKDLGEIGGRAFQNAVSLQGIVIPKNVSSMGDFVFLENPSCAIYLEDESLPSTWNPTWNAYSYPTFLYSETEISDGLHWHYNENGAIAIWN